MDNIDMNGGLIKLDPPGIVETTIKNERGEPHTSRFKADLINLPDPNRTDDYFWADMEGTMVDGCPQKDLLRLEIYR